MLRITSERAMRGWSQSRLAREAEMSASTISQIESGRMSPYPSQLEKIARALGHAADAAQLLEEVHVVGATVE